MSVAFRAAAAAVLVASVVGSLAPGDAGRVAAQFAVSLVVAAPLARVAALGASFARERDWRFVGVALAVLVVVASGAVIAWLAG